MTDEQRSSFSKNSLFLRRIKNLPAIERRVGGEFFGDDGRPGVNGDECEQAGQRQQTDFFHG